jgi:phytoene desaturase
LERPQAQRERKLMVKTVIIGAGIGGLSAAIRLQIAGHQVVIYEKNERLGGKMYQIEQDGFRFDTGPSVITMKHVFEDLFLAAGRNLQDYLQLEPVEPMTRYFYPDNFVLDATADLQAMMKQIESIDKRDVEGYLAYLNYASEIHRVTGKVFIYDKPPTFGSFAKVPIWDWLKADPFRTMNTAIKGFVTSPKLQQLLGRFATYVGGSPYLAPATLNVIADIELSGGVWYPRGGIYQIALALEKLALELGSEIYRGCGVAQILVKDQKAVGVRLENGQEISARLVLSNLDVAMSYQKLLAESGISPSRIQQMSSYEPSCSGFIMLLGVEGRHEALAHHNILFSENYEAEFEAIFKHQIPPQNPTFYIAITSKTDSDHAPQGCENWFVMVNAPAMSKHYNWSDNQETYKNVVLTKLAERGFDIRGKIRTERILNPNDLEKMSGAWKGALYGSSPNNRFAAFLRPHNRCKDVQGLYFAGGTSHPGGGVPMVMLSGKVAADMILEDGV